MRPTLYRERTSLVNSYEWAVMVVVVIAAWSAGMFALGYQSGKDDSAYPGVPPVFLPPPDGQPYPAADDAWDRALIGLNADEGERLASTGELQLLLGEHLSPEGVAEILDGPDHSPAPCDLNETGEVRTITAA